MITVYCIYMLLKTKGLIQLDEGMVKVVAMPVIVSFLLAVGTDVAIIKFLISH